MPKISFIVPTLNRPQALKNLLDSFELQTVKPDEIIIVEQGDHFTTPPPHHPTTLNIKNYTVDFVSLTKARNFGVGKASGDIIGFLDDDIVLDKDYVKNILNFFVTNPEALGVQGMITDFEVGHAKKVGGNKIVYKLYNWLAKIFLLNNSSTKNKLLWSGRNQYASRADKIINCEWLSGIGNYRKQIFTEFKFDESLAGYALGEDKLFSYPIFIKYPKSLFLDPDIKCEHHHADSGRPKDKDWVKMKIEYTNYLWNKLFKSKGFLACLGYFWANLGDVVMVFFSILLGQNSLKFLGWHLKGYWYLLWKK